ncbi:MAG: response regulator [Caldilineaceae bacterium]|nr:response regulator [Caldilineaceae bacterium]
MNRSVPSADMLKQEERRTEATRRINATLAQLVAVERHDDVRQQLLEIIAGATGYRYALLSEMEADERHLRIVAAHMPGRLIQSAEALLGFTLIGHRVVNEPGEVLQTPPTELFDHIYEWRAEIPRPVSTAIEFLMGIRQIASIRLHTGDYYLGAANFFATQRTTDLALLEYLCNNHLVYAVRLIQEQAARERLQALRTQELQREIQVRQQAEEAIRTLYAITADQKMSFAEKVQALLEMGCRRFGLEVGIFSHIVEDEYRIEEVYAPGMPMQRGDIFPLHHTYCEETLKAHRPLSFEHAGGSRWARHPCYEIFRIEAYLGTAVHVLAQQSHYIYGTLSFASSHPKLSPFVSSDHEFLSLMAQWIGGEIERQQRTEQLQAYATQLEHTHKELAEAHDRALEVSRLKSEFLATMSHEIRTPMNGITGMTELLIATGLNERQQYYASIVLRETDHLLRIINDILDFSKMEAGRVALGHEGFSPLTVVESVASLLSPQAAAKQLAVMSYVAPNVPTVLYGDASRLRQILLNLVGNAIKFTDRGDVLIEINIREITTTTAMLYCTVSDTGIGIDENSIPNIFQPFTQVDGGVTRRHGGTGLGLAIAYRLVNLMGGEIGVQSTINEGSSFWFTARFERSLRVREEFLNDEQVLARVRILLVEEGYRHTALLEQYLSDWGASVQRTTTETEAWTHLLHAADVNLPYDLVIIDQIIPTFERVHFGRQIRQHATLGSTTLLLLTAMEQTEVRRQAVESHFNGYVTIPLRRTELQQSLLAAVRGEPISSESVSVEQNRRPSLEGNGILNGKVDPA